MHRSPSPLSADVRAKIAAELNARLADGLDLHGQIKVAHWNVKGPHFSSLHPLFETFAITLAAFNDTVAERAVTLGAQALGATRHVGKASRLAEYPQDVTRGVEHVALLADRFDVYLEGLRASRSACEETKDTDTVDLLTTIITEFEKNSWFLRASLEGE